MTHQPWGASPRFSTCQPGASALRLIPNSSCDKAPAFTAWRDDFFSSYYRLRPVNATFIGIHDEDHRLPDYSEEATAAATAGAPAADTAPPRALSSGEVATP